ncbi:carbohydrate-binding domain-containing protein [Maribellus comscasis]|uniref:Carbohydrate-binding domain-containing protein n=1 Tax=Maribellus comscasis TaxID=2681766 RepID=A0A6I6JYK9_9BACT|nr:carbohydrate-binding domain-containing protein [Maribellus comscasis]QGY46230.1 carbohydrate-binding domain-containing protein [Maribellus comscasis]
MRVKTETFKNMKKWFFYAWAVVTVLFASCEGLTPGTGTEEEEQQDVVNEETIEEAVTNNAGDHDDTADYTWDSNSVTQISLNGSSATESSDDVTIESGNIVIGAAGNYSFSGTLSNGQIIVNTEDEEIVRLILDGVDISCSNSAPIYIKSAEKVLIALNENTTNKLTDGSSYNYDDEEDEEPNAAIFSKSDLTIFGEGTLVVDANFNDGITSKDGLIIASGNISVTAVDDGIRGKDYIIIKNGNFTVESDGDGLKSDNDSDDSKGYIEIYDGTFDISAKGDAVSAETDLMIEYAEIELTTSGSTSSYYESTSSKGLKAGVNIIIDDGIFSLNCADDAIHSNQTITINSGTYEISSGDDGIHSDYDLVINDGDINITKSYEGIESGQGDMEINKGTIHIKSSDDGINLSAGGDAMGGGGPWGGGSTSSGNYYIYINGAYIYINASGDGLDSNGNIKMTDGTVLVDGPTNSGNGALDCNGSFTITGGLLIAAGSSGMAEAPASSSDQYSVLVKFNSTKSGGTIFHVESEKGEEILTYKPSKNYQSVAFSSPDLTKGESYSIYTGGSSTGDETDGLFSGGTYTPGSVYVSFDITSMTYTIQ